VCESRERRLLRDRYSKPEINISASTRSVPLTIFLIALATSGALAQGAVPVASAGALAVSPPPKTAVYESERLDEVTRSMASRRLFQGAVLVARGDHVLLERGYGPPALTAESPTIPSCAIGLDR
jgi:hypothetical protein